MDADNVDLSRKLFAKHKLNFFPSHYFNYENSLLPEFRRISTGKFLDVFIYGFKPFPRQFEVAL